MSQSAIHIVPPPAAQARKRVVTIDGPFDPKRIDEIAQLVLSDPEISAVRVVEKPKKWGGSPSSIFFFAREADIRRILNDDKTFILHPYDSALAAAAGDVRFILGAESKALETRREMVRVVVGERDSAQYAQLTERIRMAAREAAAEFVAHLRCRGPKENKFNIIRDYGYLIPYLVTSRIVGVSGPDRPTLLVRALIFARNVAGLFGGRRWLHWSPEQKRCQTAVLWSHLIFGHIFTNFENRNGGLLALAKQASSEFKAQLDRLMERNVSDFEDTLMSEFLKKRNHFPHVPTPIYRAYVRSIMFEFTGAMTLLVAISFGRMLNTLVSRGASWPEFLKDIRGPFGDLLIQEAMRLNPTTAFLFRYVNKRTDVSDVELEPGDHVCVLIGGCGKAVGDFRHPPPKDATYLNFGPDFGPGTGPHSCFGQKWARAILQEMFAALADVERLKFSDNASSVYEFLGLPDHLEMELAPPPQT